MSKLHISKVEVQEGHLYEKWGEDEPIHCFDLVVYAYADGDVYVHEHVFYGAVENDGYWYPDRNAKNDADKFASKVMEKGIIDLTHWTLVGNVTELMKTKEERLEESWSDISDHYEDYY